MLPPRPCLECGAPSPTPRCRRCTLSRRSALYGPEHRNRRAEFEALVAAGGYPCCLCDLPIDPAGGWDLAHRGSRPSLPAHPACNRRLPAR